MEKGITIVKVNEKTILTRRTKGDTIIGVNIAISDYEGTSGNSILYSLKENDTLTFEYKEDEKQITWQEALTLLIKGKTVYCVDEHGIKHICDQGLDEVIEIGELINYKW